MPWTSVIVTLRARNSTAGGAPERSIAIDGLAATPYWIQDDAGARTRGADGRRFNNVAQNWGIDVVVRRFRIDAGEWDFGDYMRLMGILRGAFLDVTAVQDAARIQTGTTLDGTTDFDFWTDATNSPLPWPVVATFDKPELDFTIDRPARLILTLESATPTIGLTLP